MMKHAVIHRAAQRAANNGYWMGTPEGWVAYLPNFYGWECIVCHRAEDGAYDVARWKAGTGAAQCVWEKEVIAAEMKALYD